MYGHPYWTKMFNFKNTKGILLMNILTKSIFIIAVFIFFKTSTFAQSKANTIVGDWEISKWEYLKKPPFNSSEIEKESKNKFMSFKKGNSVETTQINSGKKEIIASGTYDFSEDRKYLNLDDRSFEIVKFEKDEIAIKFEADLIWHLTRYVESR